MPTQPSTDLSTFRLRRRTPGSFILVPCPQEGRSLRCQGHLEADAGLILSACAQVIRVQEQPVHIWYAWRPIETGCQIRLLDQPLDRRPRQNEFPRVSYVVPDFLVERTCKSQHLLEVKPARKLAHPVVERKLAVARVFAANHGWTFHVLTEREIRRGFLLANLRLLRRYRLLPVDSRLTERLASCVPSTGLRLEELIQQSGPSEMAAVAYQHAMHMLCIGQLTFDPEPLALDSDTLIFPKGAMSWDPFASRWAPSGCSTGEPTVSSANPPPTNSLPST
jgi:hypothetical protein